MATAFSASVVPWTEDPGVGFLVAGLVGLLAWALLAAILWPPFIMVLFTLHLLFGPAAR